MSTNKNAPTEAKALNKKSHDASIAPQRLDALNRSAKRGYAMNLHRTDFAGKAVASRRAARYALRKAGYSEAEADALLYRMGYRTGGEA